MVLKWKLRNHTYTRTQHRRCIKRAATEAGKTQVSGSRPRESRSVARQIFAGCLSLRNDWKAEALWRIKNLYSHVKWRTCLLKQGAYKKGFGPAAFDSFNEYPASGRLRSRSLHDTEKKMRALVCIVWGVMALISRHEKPNSAILEFWVPWGFWEIAGIVCYVLNPWASFNWPRSEPYGQRNVSETFDGMCTIFRVHRIRPWNHGLQVQLQERESQPSKPIHSI